MGAFRLLVCSHIVAALAAAPLGAAGSGDGRLTPAEVSARVTSAMDKSVDPCEDFYRYACGGWMAATKIPPDRSRWSRSFTEITERNLVILRDILEKAAARPGGDANRARLGAYYNSCIDETAIEKAGLDPLKPLLADIATVQDVDSLFRVTARLQASGINALFSPRAMPDFKEPGIVIAHLFQGGLGMPDRDYYVKTDERSAQLRSAYEAHVTRMMGLLGESQDQAAADAKQILAFETELAKVSLPRAEARNREKIYNRVDLAGLKRMTPGLPWDSYLASLERPVLTQISVGMPDFMKGMEKLVASTPPATLQTYLRWNLVRTQSDLLPKSFVDESFDFFGRQLAGQKELQPRWKRCVQATDRALGESMGQAFVDQQFPGDSKAIALGMIQDIESAFETGLKDLEWMDTATRERAAGKMHQIANKIGYPDTWRDYSSMQIGSAGYFANGLAASRFEARRQLDKMGKPTDRTEWSMTPPTVNAYYNGLNNEMVFPAGIMQEPFFHRDYPIMMNFGGIGMVMGHELTHGFDDQGRKFDGEGRMIPWWAEDAVRKFEQQARCVDDLYSGYEVQPGVKLNGKLTLGENIADLGGLKEAYRAWRAWAAENGEPAPIVEGLTNDQLFFVSFAQNWCALSTPESERMLATTDSHSHARYRAIGPTSQSDEFAKTFQCAPGTRMNPATKCRVW